MLKEEVRKKIHSALSGWLKERACENTVISLEVPPKEFKADLAFNASMTLGRILKKKPRMIAEELKGIIDAQLVPGILSESSIAGPGFMNLKIAPRFLIESFSGYVDKKFKLPEDKLDKKVCVEFVSANPTGPLHVGHGRGAAIGDSLARIFEHFGSDVTREYYVNNIGNQVQILGRSVEARLREIKGEKPEFPEDGYKGDYIKDLAKKYLEEKRTDSVEVYAYREILKIIKSNLSNFGVEFTRWSLENELHDKGLMDKTLEQLKKKNVLYESDGALWLKSTDFKDEKDRVVRRSDGRYTYLASDMAYHNDKINRKFDQLIDIWGADHYGYQKRIEAVVHSLGFDLNDFNIILYQLVRLLRNGKIVTMSTRSGEFVTLDEVVAEVGKDACRFFFLLRSPESHLDFDLELAKKHTSDNPVYYVQYAHARISSIFKEAEKRNIKFENRIPAAKFLSEEREIDLLKQVVFFPDLLRSCLKDKTLHYITTYLIETVRKFHAYYDNHRVITDDAELTQARLFLINGVREMIALGLKLLGISAPEKM